MQMLTPQSEAVAASFMGAIVSIELAGVALMLDVLYLAKYSKTEPWSHIAVVCNPVSSLKPS